MYIREVKTMNEVLLYFVLKYKGDWSAVYRAIIDHEQVDIKHVKKAISIVRCEYLTVADQNYPKYFKRINKPPFVLFYQGDITNFEEKLISLHGSLNTINIQYLKILNEFGYVFIYALDHTNFADIKKMLTLNFKVNIYIPYGINNSYIKTVFRYMHDHTLIFSDAYENRDTSTHSLQDIDKILLGHNNKVLFIGNDDYESVKDKLDYCQREENTVYKIVCNNSIHANES